MKTTRRSFVTFSLACAATALSPDFLETAHAQDLESLVDQNAIWEPNKAITTTIKDALPPATLYGLDDARIRPIPDSWKLAPGHYRSDVRSYCLHAGTYGPTKGTGYLICPLKGSRSSVIVNILDRSRQFPGIEQQDVQRLIWGIEDGAQWDSFSDEYRARVAPLLTGPEIAVLNLQPKVGGLTSEVKKRFGGLIPGGAKRVVDQYAELRSKIVDTRAPYSELEAVAVRSGVAPWGKDSRKDVQPGVWAAVGKGFYMRAFPKGYSTTTLEVYYAAPANLTYDAEGRITRFESDGRIIETAYDNTPATGTIDSKSVPIWKFKSVVFKNPDGQTYTVPNKGFIVAGSDTGVRRMQVAGRGNLAFARPCPPPDSLDDMKHYNDGL
ncbi:MAG: hypothetical protein H7145_13765, partial [Akkermansiaceae bacterium]|nr:hypothetical protein [Armatimonadota bacterium]